MAQRLANYPLSIDSQGILTDPTSGTLVADTGALPGGIYEVVVIAGATTNLAQFSVQRRNAANSANVGDVQTMFCAANSGTGFPFRFEIERDERVRVVMAASYTGDTFADITAQRVS